MKVLRSLLLIQFSRHSRSLVKKISKKVNSIEEKRYKLIYKVFILYKPGIYKTSAIKRKIKTIIIFVDLLKTLFIQITFAAVKQVKEYQAVVSMLQRYCIITRYRPIHIPTEHLNSIFVDLDIKEYANEPKYVRSKKRT